MEQHKETQSVLLEQKIFLFLEKNMHFFVFIFLFQYVNRIKDKIDFMKMLINTY